LLTLPLFISIPVPPEIKDPFPDQKQFIFDFAITLAPRAPAALLARLGAPPPEAPANAAVDLATGFVELDRAEGLTYG
jgi:hypothetical protein